MWKQEKENHPNSFLSLWVWMRSGCPMGLGYQSRRLGNVSALLASPLAQHSCAPPSLRLVWDSLVCVSLFAHSPHPSLSCRFSLHFSTFVHLGFVCYLSLLFMLKLLREPFPLPVPCVSPAASVSGATSLRCGPHLTHTCLKG